MSFCEGQPIRVSPDRLVDPTVESGKEENLNVLNPDREDPELAAQIDRLYRIPADLGESIRAVVVIGRLVRNPPER